MRIICQHWQKEEDTDRVRCLLCPHNCLIPAGQTGRCRVRKNEHGQLWTLNYGELTAAALDPMEKKPLYHFHPGKTILSFGTFGCNMRCRFCQNHEISQMVVNANALTETDAHNGAHAHTEADARAEADPRAETDVRTSADSLRARRQLEAADLGRLVAMQEQSCVGAAFTYSEPSVWYEYVYDAARHVKEKGFVNVLVTNGFLSEKALADLLPFVDAANVDLKSFRDDFYREVCGASLKPVLETIVTMKKALHLELTTLLVPGLNDGVEEIEKMAAWVAAEVGKDTPLHLSRYFPAYRMELPPTPEKTIAAAYEAARVHLQYVYTGNIAVPYGQDTDCPACGSKLIRRNFRQVHIVGLSDRRCKACGLPVPIVM